MAARWFLILIAVFIVLAVLGAVGWAAFGDRLMQAYLTPTVAFADSPKPPPTLYDDPASWVARPGIPSPEANWTPAGYRPAPETAASVFYVHPTTYLQADRWNAPLEPDDEGALFRRGLFTRSQASVFNGIADIWAPKYRQAAFGAFLAFDQPDAARAFALAYTDIAKAFAIFLANTDPERPIILAGHSQGSLHVLTLLARDIAGTPLTDRLVAVYAPGWPISIDADLPALGLPPCAAPEQTGCLLGWQSFAEPADPALITDAFDLTTGFAGVPRADTELVCTNPLTGGAPGPALADANIGTLVPERDMSAAELEAGLIGADCTGRGYLSLGADAPDLGGYILPGNNYHVYDYPLFWANVRADAERRVNAFLGR
ncbi:MAG: DUF3089 domain-containing protein [Pseudomonadota bacterium]